MYKFNRSTPANAPRIAIRNLALQTTMLVSLAMSAGTVAYGETRCDEALVPQPEDCRRANSDIVVTMPAGENTETIDHSIGGAFGQTGFSISIDEKTIAGAPAPHNSKRRTDISAAAAQVDVRYDGLDQKRALNVSTSDLRAAYRAGERIRFRTSTNYPDYIARAEVRIIDRSKRGNPVVATLPARANGETDWVMPADGSDNLAYVLRVYDSRGRYDETMPLDLHRTERAFDTHETVGGPVIAAGEGEDRTRIRNIPVRGGRITVSGTGVQPQGRVMVMGQPVPVDASGKFVTSRILPVGDHIVTVEVPGARRIVRDVEIPRNEWFYVGIADLTFGKRLRDDLASADPDYSSTYTDGRLAFYVKGKTQNGYTITSSLDTGEGDIADIFSRLDQKDPRRVLMRLDPEDLYPTYGDDSTSFDDTPTSGRVYLRVEKDASSLTWGDFKADVRGSHFLTNTRSLYGAELRYVSPTTTENGEARTRVSLYAAQPDTLPQRDILRGTGGSVYFLTHQDINGGSETLAIQTVDPDTGRIVDTRILVEGVDYQIDYIQGVVNLTNPLASSGSGSGLITDGGGRYDLNLVAQYEYTPTTGSLSGASVGGRIEVQASDRLRLGLTAMKETTGLSDQKMAGIDLHYDLGKQSYIEAEVAQTEGIGFGRSISTDGGLMITPDGPVANPRARAYRFDSHFDLAELGAATPGFVDVYYERKDAGFSTLSEDITQDQTLIGTKGEIKVSQRLTFGFEAEDFDRSGGDRKTSGELRLDYAINDTWSVEAALAHLDKTTVGNPSETGRRTDFGLRVNYQPNEDLKVYVFGQATVNNSGGLRDNDRLGLGFEAQVSEKVALSGEISGGTRGRGGALKATYSPTADNEIYLGYTLDPTRLGAGYDLVGRDRGTVVLGGRYRVNEAVSTYMENTWDMFGERQSLTRTYGVNYTPDARWTVSGSVETGRVRDTINGDFDRDAFSLGVAYVNDDLVKARARLEYRTEDGAGLAQDRKTWAFSAGYEYKVNDDWRFLANVDSLVSDSAQSDFRDGEYVEASLGYAYRPVDNDRLNLLAKYTYLRDLPGEDQVTVDGTTNGPKQISHVFSIDGNYDLSPRLTFGAKYGFRKSQVAPRGTNTFTDSTAHLGILRLDWHVIHKWDMLAEGRVLYTKETKNRETGALLGIYRHIGNNAKIGLGYEWGKVSDDITNLDYVGRGVFLNLVAKF